MFSISKLSLLLTAAAASVAALPSAVVSPHITAPHAVDVWPAGSVQTVSWDTTDVPAGAVADIFLGHFEDGSESEHLDLANPLATDVDLTLGSTQVTVPSVTPMESYIVALVGSSGNISPEFSITA
ncbi:uncharacterized protein BXZ73DRAFT_103895 [Epithele typhae]|uniref:uncharacterized protein n=1 Tax=Epithele typhae TaxID=378194 RepID=UPI0020072DB0|nr:uncharacterized protein BXZ73DRAFT_103895 [Epithele typhae]KAH9923462.1 hypothetical protein BXZ73DRAFT_103895 [Epithele typhae]